MSSITAKQALAAIKKHGNKSEAARSLGMTRHALRWLLERQNSHRPVREPAEIDAKAAKQEADKLKAERDEALQQLQRARGVGKMEPLRVGKARKSSVEDFVRVIIPDSHGAHIARNAAAAFLADLKQINPHEIIMLGDHLDCGGFLAQHQTMGYVAETETSFEADVIATNEFLDQIQTNAPKASITYIEGNHESRVERWCVTQALRNKRDAQFLLDTFGPVAVLGLQKRGIQYIRSSGRYDDLPIPGTIRRGTCCFTHGIGFGVHATHDHVRRFSYSIVHGHTHRAQSSIIRTVGGGLVGGWSPGCLAQLQPYYMATSPTDWSHGYGIQFVAKSGKFLHLNVPIMDGESMLLRGGSLLASK